MLTALQQALDDVARDDTARGGAGWLWQGLLCGHNLGTWQPTPSWLTTKSCLHSAAA